jgi:hypothetical protein
MRVAFKSQLKWRTAICGFLPQKVEQLGKNQREAVLPKRAGGLVCNCLLVYLLDGSCEHGLCRAQR